MALDLEVRREEAGNRGQKRPRLLRVDFDIGGGYAYTVYLRKSLRELRTSWQRSGKGLPLPRANDQYSLVFQDWAG